MGRWTVGYPLGASPHERNWIADPPFPLFGPYSPTLAAAFSRNSEPSRIYLRRVASDRWPVWAMIARSGTPVAAVAPNSAPHVQFIGRGTRPHGKYRKSCTRNALTFPHFPDRRRSKSLAGGRQLVAGGGMARAARFGTSRPRNRNCPSGG